MKSRKIASMLLCFALTVTLTACGGSSTESDSSSDTSTPATASEEKVKTYGTGTYIVGEDIESGLYRATVGNSGMAYIERSKDLSMELDSILANIILTGDGYVEILSSDKAVSLMDVTLEKIDLETLTPDIKTEVADGIYLVGYDIEPGTYKVEVTDETTGMGYVQRSRSLAMGMDDIIANDIVQGSSYVEVAADDFALNLQGVKITKK